MVTIFSHRSRRFSRLAGACLFLLLPGLAVVSAGSAVTVSRGTITLPTYPWETTARHPYFRGTDGNNIYPYPMLDNLSRDKSERQYRTVVLENEHLRLLFLPDLGGRVHEVINKTTGQPVFYVNHVIKPGLIGQCGAWISGGIEWNTGPQGHTVSCVQPVDFQVLPAERDGSRSVAIGETERIYGTKWTVRVTLRPGRSFIEESIRIYNPTTTVRPYYFWNCTAVPNTSGFRFVYPMTLGTDHGGEQFFHWPIHEGKDLTRGTNYQDASSIFAYGCDQDFFGSYNDDLRRGVVAYANHHQVPGKKAWTWGWGSYGMLHQADLTDNDGPYNEVQTGPLLTQGEVGRLEPHEVVAWQEWWYPVHDLGGFVFANRDVAVNVERQGGQVVTKILGTGAWRGVRVSTTQNGRLLSQTDCEITPRRVTTLTLADGDSGKPIELEIRSGATVLASFRMPLDLPVPTAPAKPKPPETASELIQAGWKDFLFARADQAEANYRKALEKDARSAEAQAGLAFLGLDRDPAKTVEAAVAALATDPDAGAARYARAVAEYRLGHEAVSRDEAWAAALSPELASPARALIAKLCLRSGDASGAIQALSESGSWQTDPVCRNLLGYAFVQRKDKARATALAAENLAVDPLDAFALSVGWLAGNQASATRLAALMTERLEALLDLVTAYAELRDYSTALRLADEFACEGHRRESGFDLLAYWSAFLRERCAAEPKVPKRLDDRRSAPEVGGTPAVEGTAFPHRWEMLEVLRWAIARNPSDGKAHLYLGHLLFHLGRQAEGRAEWQKAAELGAQAATAYRALGMASKTLDHDLAQAAKWLESASRLDPADAIVARDLATVRFALADKAASEAERKALVTQVRDSLKTAFAAGKGRADFVALLARAHTRLGEHAETARLLDSVRITIWEGAREAHDLFEEAHLTLGRQHLDAGRNGEALAEFNRALEYPSNLATGRLDNTREAHIHYLRGRALSALGRTQEAKAAWTKAADEPSSGDVKKEEARRLAREALQ